VRRARRDSRRAGRRARPNRGRRILFETATRRSCGDGARSYNFGGGTQSPQRHSLMKSFATIAASLAFAAIVSAEKIALVNATVIDPATQRVMSNAIVVIDGNKIAAVGDAKTASAPKDARVIDCTGKFILPGYIDTHVHFFQSADLFTRPDGADLNSVRPYKDEVAWIKSHLDDTF